MRWLLILICSCNEAMTPAPEAYGLRLQLTLGPAAPVLADLSLTTFKLHLTNLAAVSDRGANDSRARKDFADVSFGETASIDLLNAPSGTYSALEWSLGDGSTAGLDLEGTAGGQRMHVQLVGGPFAVRCTGPRQLQPGSRVQLSLTVDATSWFDGVDLTTAMNDEDDQGIIINMEDNAPLAFEILDNAIKSFQ